MRAQLAAPPEAAIKVLSKPKGNDVSKAVDTVLSWAASENDHALVQRSVRLMRIVIRALKTALPDTDRELIGGICADLFDLWETGQKLDKELKKLAKFRFPRDRQRLRDTLVWIDAIQLDMASYWIGEVRKDLPKLFKALDQQEICAHIAKSKKPTHKRHTGQRRGR